MLVEFPVSYSSGVCLCICVCREARGGEPPVKQAKLDDSADLSGGLPSMLKTIVTEVCVIIWYHLVSSVC